MGDFDTIINRSNTNLIKWNEEYVDRVFNDKNLLSFWIADMDFSCSINIQKALQKSVQQGHYGYAHSLEPIKSFVSWIERRFHYKLALENVLYVPGILTALSIAISIFSNEGEGVLIQEPVYYSFKKIISKNNRKVVINNLIKVKNHYEVDFKDFEQKISLEKTKIFILCSPHNPIGKVWTKHELKKMMDICLKHNVFVIVDEVHCDLVYKGITHYPVLSLGEKYRDISLSCYSPSKAFNLAGLKYANVVIKNLKNRQKYSEFLKKLNLISPNIFAIPAVVSAYNNGEVWLDNLLVYIEKNYEFVCEYLKENLPKAIVFDCEATYLVWIDFSSCGYNDVLLKQKITHEAKLAVDYGIWFGESGTSCIRLNIACSRKLLIECLERLVSVFTNKKTP